MFRIFISLQKHSLPSFIFKNFGSFQKCLNAFKVEANNFKFVEFYSRMETKRQSKREMNFRAYFFPHRPFPFGGFIFSRQFQFLPFLPEFFSSPFFLLFSCLLLLVNVNQLLHWIFKMFLLLITSHDFT